MKKHLANIERAARKLLASKTGSIQKDRPEVSDEKPAKVQEITEKATPIQVFSIDPDQVSNPFAGIDLAGEGEQNLFNI